MLETRMETNRFAVVAGVATLRRAPLEILQVNVGRLCNQTCRHCHVNAGPTRTELMTLDVARQCAELLDRFPGIHTLDITGGAPEMAPPFRWLVTEGRRRHRRVIDRCNLTILSEPGYEDLADFLACQQVDVVASLPCYTAENVDRQRGDGVFAASINGLRILNQRGYGKSEGRDPNAALQLTLVYNPGGPSLPGPQATLEADYRRRLMDDFGVRFDRLICIANMPIGRFRSDLQRTGKLDEYIGKLEAAYNPATLVGLMCRNTLSVDHEGYLYDCDFNQMAGLGISRGRLHVGDIDPVKFAATPIATATHCLGCTAGAGSSCGGAIA
jgi:radical SAM/Cys-rich protein